VEGKVNVKDWLIENKDPSVREKLAFSAGTTIGYLNQLAHTPKKPGINTCKKLYEASKKVTPNSLILPKDMRPDIAEIFFINSDIGEAA
jgi:hypothetical protein